MYLIEKQKESCKTKPLWAKIFELTFVFVSCPWVQEICTPCTKTLQETASTPHQLLLIKVANLYKYHKVVDSQPMKFSFILFFLILFQWVHFKHQFLNSLIHLFKYTNILSQCPHEEEQNFIKF